MRYNEEISGGRSLRLLYVNRPNLERKFIMAKKTNYPSIDRTHLKGISFSKLHPLLILPLNLLFTFLLINSKNLGKLALIKNGVAYTRKQLRDDTIRAAKALLANGFKPGDTIAIVTPNVYESIVMTFAANALGSRIFYFNDLANAGQILTDLALYKVNVLVAHQREDLPVDFIRQCVPDLRLFIDVSSAPPGDFVPFDKFMDDAKRYEGNIYPILARYAFSKKDSIFLQTSGSTAGRPKILPFSNENVFASMIYASNSTGIKTNDSKIEKVLCILPFRLPYGWMTIFVNLLGGNLVELARGGEVNDIANYWKAGASYIYATPQIFQVFMDQTPEDTDLSSLKAFFVSGFAMPEPLYQKGIRFLRAHNSNAEIRNNYGIGEGLCVGTAADGVPHRENTSGKFYVGPKWLIVDEDLKEVKYGEIGEALLRAKSLCNGYYNDAEATAKAFIHLRSKHFPFLKKRFYRTGDYVSLAADGYVSFIGRKKRFYQPLGAVDKVNCGTIEEVLATSVLVKASAVVIYSPDGKSESSCAFIVPMDKTASPEDLRRDIAIHLGNNLLDYQLPTKLVFVDEIPIMGSGKPDYVKMEELANTNP